MDIRFITTAILTFALTACSESERVATVPSPAEPTRDAIGYYCNMIVVDHQGPKGQVFIRGHDEPVWFTSVRDTITFTLLPEEPKDIAAIYVNDMGRASWERPEAGTWIDARQAWYVIGSDKIGGMGAPELVPFATQSEAKTFASRHGGDVLPFAEVPSDVVLASVAVRALDGGEQSEGHSAGEGNHGD